MRPSDMEEFEREMQALGVENEDEDGHNERYQFDEEKEYRDANISST